MVGHRGLAGRELEGEKVGEMLFTLQVPRRLDILIQSQVANQATCDEAVYESVAGGFCVFLLLPAR